MKSDFNEKIYVECACKNMQHLFIAEVFSLSEDEEELKQNPNLLNCSICFTSNYKLPFLKRLWLSIKFIFNKETYCTNDEILINKNNLNQLKELVNYLELKYDELGKE